MGGNTGPKKQLGKINLQQRVVVPDALGGARDSRPRGRLPLPDALTGLAESTGAPAVDLTQEIIDLSILKLVPREVAVERRVLPFKLGDDDQLMVAMAAPDDAEAVEEVGFLAGHEVVAHVALEATLHDVTEAAYRCLTHKRSHYAGDRVDDERRKEVGLPTLADAVATELDERNGGDGDGERRSGVTSSGDGGGEPVTGTAAIPPPASETANAQGEAGVKGATARAEEDAPPTTDGDAADPAAPALDSAFSERPRASVTPSAEDYGDRSVLVACNDAELLGALDQQIADTGVTLQKVESEDEAIEQLAEHAPALVLLSAELAEGSGFDLCRRLKGDADDDATPVVMTSEEARGWRFAADLRESFHIKHYFEAPFDAAEIARNILVLLEGRDPGPRVVVLSEACKAQLDASMEAFEAGDLDQAITHLESGASMTPDSFELQYHLGLLYGRRDELFQAIAALETAVEQRPRDFSALKNLAVVYQRAGFRHRAAGTWERAMSVAPDDKVRQNIKQHLISML